MNQKSQSTRAVQVLQALRRAALRAREIARRTGTKLIVVHNGVLRELDPDSPELQDTADES